MNMTDGVCTRPMASRPQPDSIRGRSHGDSTSLWRADGPTRSTMQEQSPLSRGCLVERETPPGDLAWTDEELLDEYRLTGREELFAELVQRYEGELFAYLFRYLGERSLAEDVFQATFLQLHLKCGTFHRGRKLRPWLYRIATNQAIDALRRARRHHRRRVSGGPRDGQPDGQKWLETFPDLREPYPADTDDGNDHRWLQAAIDSLPSHLRSPLVLVYFQGLKYREAAEVLAVPLGTLKSRMFAAMMRLREAGLAEEPDRSAVDAQRA